MKIFILETILLSMALLGDAKPKQVRRRVQTTTATATSVTTTGTSPIHIPLECPASQYPLLNATSRTWSCELRSTGADGRAYSQTMGAKSPKGGKSGGASAKGDTPTTTTTSSSGATAKADTTITTTTTTTSGGSAEGGNTGSGGLPDKFNIQCPSGYVAEYIPIPKNYWTCTAVMTTSTSTSTNTNP